MYKSGTFSKIWNFGFKNPLTKTPYIFGTELFEFFF